LSSGADLGTLKGKEMSWQEFWGCATRNSEVHANRVAECGHLARLIHTDLSAEIFQPNQLMGRAYVPPLNVAAAPVASNKDPANVPTT
jgi:hypothetical protein